MSGLTGIDAHMTLHPNGIAIAQRGDAPPEVGAGAIPRIGGDQAEADARVPHPRNLRQGPGRSSSAAPVPPPGDPRRVAALGIVGPFGRQVEPATPAAAGTSPWANVSETKH